MNKLVLKFLIFFSFSYFFLMCKIQPGPERVLSEYFDALSSGKFEEAYNYISQKDKNIKDLNSYLIELKVKDNPISKFLLSKISYKIKSTKVSGKYATVEVEVIEPDMEKIMSEIMKTSFELIFKQEKSAEDIEKKLEEKIKNMDIPLSKKVEKYTLIKEPEGWRVYFNWEKEEKVKRLLKQARDLEEKKRFLDAKQKYEELLKMDSTNTEALQKIEELTKKIKIWEEKKRYFEKIQIRNVRVKESFLGKWVSGELKNLGDRTLKKVEITIYFLDKKGKPIYEETHYPVFVSEFSWNDNKPLKPGYSKKFGYSADDVPSDWAGKVKIEVTDIEFE